MNPEQLWDTTMNPETRRLVEVSIEDGAKYIYITLYKDTSISVEDDGRGIPVDMHPKYNRPGL